MESIVYRFNLDTQKSGVQKTLQGFSTGDVIARKLFIGLAAGSSTQAIDSDHVEAMMYVYRPESDNPDINACEVDGNTIKYTVLKSDIMDAGYVTMQLRLIYTNPNTGSTKVIAAPKFQLEVQYAEDIDRVIEEGISSGTFEGSFTALEKAVAKAQAYYHTALRQIEFDEEYVFHAYYADGTEYINDDFSDAYKEAVQYGKDAIEKAAESKASAEASEFFRNMAEAYLEATKKERQIVEEAKAEVLKNSVYATFRIDFESGNVVYESTNYRFEVNSETGDLEWFREGE